MQISALYFIFSYVVHIIDTCIHWINIYYVPITFFDYSNKENSNADYSFIHLFAFEDYLVLDFFCLKI